MERPRIYQLLPRLFGNTNETRKPNGTLAENGCGKFADISDIALRSLRDELHITHLWLTGVHAQATATDYSEIGSPADDPDLLKGLAGSPYAIKDYAFVCPDYAVNPAKRMDEFRALLDRAHTLGLRVIIDFVANHVARSHRSKLFAFGENDDRRKFFSPQNNFFWLQPESPGGGPPLRLPTVINGEPASPTCRALGGCDGLFSGEKSAGRVTGNNAATWAPSSNDWYETVKLNYGFDFTTGAREFPHEGNPAAPLPDTWKKMDAILARWQALGVDGFRCDMAHMVPTEFWAWAITRARKRDEAAFFIAEAYDNDSMKVEQGNVLTALLSAGFDAVYDDPAYKTLKRIFDGPAWANDLDGTLAAQLPQFFTTALRYAENHDEVRLAAHGEWGGFGMEVGRAVSGVLFGISRGPVLIYSGQEVGEPADGIAGFGVGNSRTTIFDYWSMPEFAKWVNDHRYDGARLSPQQRSLRDFYGRLLAACDAPAFREGNFFPLNGANTWNPEFGRLAGDPASGHCLYAYLRIPNSEHAPFLVIANLHRSETFRNVRIRLSDEARNALGAIDRNLLLQDRIGGLPSLRCAAQEALEHGFLIPELPPLTSAYFEIQ
jgi:glycosidase